MNDFSIETSGVLHCQFYRSDFDVTKCGSAYIWSHEKYSYACLEFCFFKYGNRTQWRSQGGQGARAPPISNGKNPILFNLMLSH